MNFRWARAGGRMLPPFTPQAISLICRASKGIPRVINAICDSALTNAFGADLKLIDAAQILDVASDLQIDLSADVNAAQSNGTAAKRNQTQPHTPVPAPASAGAYEPVPMTFRSLERYMPKPAKTSKPWTLRSRTS
jgi:hypothetical protein